MTLSSVPLPFDESRRIGTVTKITAQFATINLPNAASQSALVYQGSRIPRGEVGEYVCIPRGDVAILGRIVEVRLPERDRLSVEPKLGRPDVTDPIGEVALLTDIDLHAGAVTGAVNSPPRLSAPAYSAPPRFLQWVLEASSAAHGKPPSVFLDVGTIPGLSEASVKVSPERLFGRHCAVLGVTGGGKSFTLARLLEASSQLRCKVVLIDATGEFFKLDSGVKHYSIGSKKDDPTGCVETGFPYTQLHESDLFAFFTPSGQSQGPTLRSALRSLKLAKVLGATNALVKDGCIPKANTSKATFQSACASHAKAIESAQADFDIKYLTAQIQHECVYPAANYGKDETKWGDANPSTQSHCTTLLMRIDTVLNDDAFKPIFACQPADNVCNHLRTFLSDADARIMRISLRHLPFKRDARPILANAIGRFLLEEARADKFKDCPVVIFLDEAHQFLNKRVGADDFEYELDAFDLIAKEGRKYGLTLCLATQRPRDIHEAVLSQMGTMIVHRLTHGADRDVVERASRDIERSVASFLPTLAPGQALIIGADFPIPIPIQITRPSKEPESRGPNYQKHWAPTA
jgi:hypothetical protein